MAASVFSPFPERYSSSLPTDARKLCQSGFSSPAGLLGLYDERAEEPSDQLRADRLAEKPDRDTEFWFETGFTTVALEPFEDLRHPHHQGDAIVAWRLEALEP